jgi:kumamolisin
MTAAFATELNRYQSEGCTFRVRTGPLHIPNEHDQVIVGIYGLDTRPQARPHCVRQAVIPHAGASPTSYTPPQIAQLYDFPTGVNGRGQSMALFELGGGYNDQDISAYFQQLGMTAPQVTSVSVNGAQNSHTCGRRSTGRSI